MKVNNWIIKNGKKTLGRIKEGRDLSWVKWVIMIVFLIGLSVAAYIWRDEVGNFVVNHLGKFGYAGIVLAAFATNAFLFVPIPVGLIFAAAIVPEYGLFPVAGLYAFGAVCGESVGYFAGAKGRKIPKVNSYSERIEKWLKKRNFIVRNGFMVFFAITPFPPFDIIGIIAGATDYPFWEFFFFCLIGRIVKYWFLFSTFKHFL